MSIPNNKPMPMTNKKGTPSNEISSKTVHQAPYGVDYTSNKSVFGGILRGEIPAIVLNETNEFLAFRDRSPRAPLHALVIPKRFVKDVTQLRSSDVRMLDDMKGNALAIIQEQYPKALHDNDYILCFHVPFKSVQHLHLHVLAPASDMAWFWRFGKYSSETPWCTGFERVRERLSAGKCPIAWFPCSS